MNVPTWMSRRTLIVAITACGFAAGVTSSVIVAAQTGPAKQQPISDSAQLPPPPYNRFIRPDTGRIEASVWDDRALSPAQKSIQPWYDPRWRPFSDCMVAAGYEVRTDKSRAFGQPDLDEILRRANAQLPDATANKTVGSNVATVPGVAGAFLQCADKWLALAPEAYGIARLEPGEVPQP